MLVNAMYDARTAYVLKVAENKNLKPAERQQLISITQNRYPQERAAVLAMFDAPGAATGPSAAVERQQWTNGDGTINGNLVAAAHGVLVKSSAVKISALHPKMEAVIIAVAKAATSLGLPQPVITSGNDGRHMPGSMHGRGRALDFRGNNISDAAGAKFRDSVAAILGKDYDVLFEIFPKSPANDHLHVEYDPD